MHSRIIDCSEDGFAFAMQVSVHSFLRMAKLAESQMTRGGCLLAMSYFARLKRWLGELERIVPVIR